MSAARVLMVMAVGFGSCALAGDPPGAKRVAPPKWSDADREVFFEDARTVLEGTRPAFSGGGAATPQDAGGDAPMAEAGPTVGGYAWSNLIAAETIESEIKRSSGELTPLVQTASAFKGGGYRDARDTFSMLAVLFATTAQYDKDVRWKDTAARSSCENSRNW